MNEPLSLLTACALPVVALVAAAEPAASPVEKMQQAFSIMERDGVIHLSPDSDSFWNRDVRAYTYSLVLKENLERCKRGEETIRDAPWIDGAIMLYSAAEPNKPAPKELVDLLASAGAVIQWDPAKANYMVRLYTEALEKSPSLRCSIIPLLVEQHKKQKNMVLLHGLLRLGADIKPFLAAGVNVNEADKTYGTLLHSAAQRGLSAENCRALLAAGADPNIEFTCFTYTAGELRLRPLDIAFDNHNIEVLRLLREHGAESEFLSPLMLACALGDEAAVKQYLAEGNEVDAPIELPYTRPQAYSTLLGIAVRAGQVHICKLLLAAGANPRVKIDSGSTLLHTAAFLGYSEICRLLVEAGADVNAVGPDGRNPLWDAMDSITGKQDAEVNAIISLLLEHGAKVNTVKDTDTPLVAAWLSEHPEWVKMLLAAGADATRFAGLMRCNNEKELEISRLFLAAGANPHAKTNSDSYPIFSMLGREPTHEAGLKMLLDAGVDVNVRNDDGDTPLLKALSCASENTVRMLLAAGASMDAFDAHGVSVLRVATECKRFDICGLLVDAGVSLNDEENSGDYAFYAALKAGQFELCQKLIDHGLSIKKYPPLLIAAAFGRADEVKQLLAAGAKPNARYRSESALLFAAHLGHTEVCKLLLAAGANVHLRNRHEWTPLLTAVFEGHAEVVAALLAAGANADEMLDNVPAIILAANRGHREIVRMLLAAGADPNKTDVEGYTALHHALITPDCDAMVDALLAAGADVNAESRAFRVTPLQLVLMSRRSLGADSFLYRKLVAAGAAVSPQDASEQAGADAEISQPFIDILELGGNVYKF